MMKLPLIQFTAQLLPAALLRNTYIIAAQHILPTTVSMIDAWLELGMRPDQISVIGKCYSTDRQAYEALKSRGVDVSESSLAFDPQKSYDLQYKENVKAFVDARCAQIRSDAFERVVILDDGGDLILYTNQLDLPFERIGGVEQTTSGYHRVSKVALRFPVVNLALAEAKLTFEPSHITNQALDELMASGLKAKRALVIGKGTVGTSVARHLAQICPVDAYDIRDAQSDFSNQSLEEILPHYDLIIGCTGTTSVPAALHQYIRPGTTLVSFSSSDREFDGGAFRSRKGAITLGNHTVHNGVTLLYHGFPSNFFSANPDDPLFFQLIRSLILGSVAQAAECEFTPGLQPLDPEFQREVVREFRQEQHMQECAYCFRNPFAHSTDIAMGKLVAFG